MSSIVEPSLTPFLLSLLSLRVRTSSRRRTISFRWGVQSSLDQVLDFTLALQPDHAARDLSVAPNEETCRHCWDAAIRGCYLLIADQDGVVDAHLICELAYFSLGRLIVKHNPDYLQSLWPVLFLQLDQPGRQDLARPDPRGPEIQQNDLSPKLRKADRFSGQRFEREVN